MKYLVTGGSGFVGKRLCARLLGEGHEVNVLSRDPLRSRKLFAKEDQIKCFLWASPDKEIPNEALEGVSVVIHLAGEGVANKRWSAAQKARISDSRVFGTRSVVSAIKKQENKGSGPSVLISASAIGYYGNRGDEELNEDSAPASSFLAQVCRAWENEVNTIDLDARKVCVRIGVVLGTESGALSKLLPPFKAGLGGPVASGKQWMSWIHVDDLVAMILHAANTDSVEGAVNAVAPNPLRNADFSKTLAGVLGRPCLFPVPAFAMKTLLGEMSAIVLDSQKVSSKKISDSGFNFSYPDLKTALENLLDKK